MFLNPRKFKEVFIFRENGKFWLNRGQPACGARISTKIFHVGILIISLSGSWARYLSKRIGLFAAEAREANQKNLCNRTNANFSFSGWLVPCSFGARTAGILSCDSSQPRSPTIPDIVAISHNERQCCPDWRRSLLDS